MRDQRRILARGFKETLGFFPGVLAGAAVLLFSILALRRAWICDDAYITLRTVDNFINGFGLRWNVAERVQAYTHPLWLLLLSGLLSLTRESFYTTILLSLAVSIASATLLVLLAARSRLSGAFAVFILALSSCFIDYATSGLENPATSLLLVVFAAVYWRLPASPRSVFLLSFVAALGILNRIDTIFLYLPALGSVFWQSRGRRSLAFLVLGQVPFVLWELFSLVYYGFPLPNTAYAKLGTGVPAGDLARHGLAYLADLLTRDPVMVLGLLAGCAAPWLTRDKRASPLVAGIVLQMVYIIGVGGDFMGGRFVTAPFLLAVLLIARVDLDALRPRHQFIAVAGVLAAGLAAATPSFMLGEIPATLAEVMPAATGISDERRFYFEGNGLFPDGLFNRHRRAGVVWPPGARRDLFAGVLIPDSQSGTVVSLSVASNGPPVGETGLGPPRLSWRFTGEQMRRMGLRLAATDVIGMIGYYAGPALHLIDRMGLGDPLLARLPALADRSWRSGHFKRWVPEGYPETAGGEANLIADRRLAAFYEHLRLITRGPLFTAERWRSIWLLNTGQLKALIDPRAYRFPDR